MFFVNGAVYELQDADGCKADDGAYADCEHRADERDRYRSDGVAEGVRDRNRLETRAHAAEQAQSGELSAAGPYKHDNAGHGGEHLLRARTHIEGILKPVAHGQYLVHTRRMAAHVARAQDHYSARDAQDSRAHKHRAPSSTSVSSFR